MLLRIQATFEPSDVELPGYMARVVGRLHVPPGQALEQGEVQQKCKMIGAAFLRAALAIVVYRNMKSVDDFMTVDRKAKNENVEAVARKLQFPGERQLKVLLGGLLLVNSFHDVLAVTESNIIPAFELFRNRRRRHRYGDD
jgi:hypothetical protein